jgi:hypothetical protein
VTAVKTETERPGNARPFCFSVAFDHGNLIAAGGYPGAAAGGAPKNRHNRTSDCLTDAFWTLEHIQ